MDRRTTSNSSGSRRVSAVTASTRPRCQKRLPARSPNTSSAGWSRIPDLRGQPGKPSFPEPVPSWQPIVPKFNSCSLKNPSQESKSHKSVIQARLWDDSKRNAIPQQSSPADEPMQDFAIPNHYHCCTRQWNVGFQLAPGPKEVHTGQRRDACVVSANEPKLRWLFVVFS